MLSHRLLVCANLVAIAAIGVVAGLSARSSEWSPLPVLVVLGVLTLLSEIVARRFEVEGAVNFSGSDVYLVCAMALLGPTPPLVFIVGAELVLSLVRRRGWLRRTSNIAALAGYTVVGGLALRTASEHLGLTPSEPAFVALLFPTLMLGNLVCTLVLALNWRVAYGESILEGLRPLVRFLPSHVIAGLLASVGVVSYARLGLEPTLLLFGAFLASEVLIGRLSTVEVALRHERDRAQRYLDIAGAIIMVLDERGRITLLNRRGSEIFGYEVSELLQRPWREVGPGTAEPELFDRLRAAAETSATFEGVVVARGGEERIIEWSARTIDDEGTVKEILASGEDVTERRRAEREVVFLAFHDRLTELPNRAKLDERLAGALDRAAGERQRIALLYVDFDNFKQVNDALGHAAGDELLREIAQRLRASTRERDIVARYGGDEFLILLGDVGPSAEDARARAEDVRRRIASALAQPFAVAGVEVSSGAAIGLALFPDDAEDAETLLQRADAAMYRKKRAGRAAFRIARARPELRSA